MEKNTKKIIAREFLWVLANLILFLFIFGINEFLISKKTDALSEKNNQIINRIDKKVYRFYLFNHTNYTINDIENKDDIKKIELATNYPDRDLFINNIKNKYKAQIYFEIYKDAFGSKISFEEFFNRIENDKYSEKYSNELNEIERLKKIYYKLSNFLLNIFIASLFISFVFRYFYYATKWSIKQLKEE